MSHYYFFAAGTPVAQGSKKHVGNGRMVESAKGLPAWRKAVAAAAAGSPLIVKPQGVAMSLAFVMPRPLSTPKQTPLAVKRPDIDKLTRAVCDSLTSVCYEDDSQVVAVYAHKRLADVGESPGVHVCVHVWVNGGNRPVLMFARGQSEEDH